MNWRVVSPDWCIFGKRIASMLNIECLDKAEGAEAAIFIEMFPGMIEEALKYKSMPKICWWTGTDVRVYKANPQVYDFGNAVHVTDTPWLVNPLSSKAPHACFLPMPCSLIGEQSPPYPKEPAILMYVSQHQARDVDRSIDFMKINKWCPIYLIDGPGIPIQKTELPDNVIALGNIKDEDRMELFKKISIYVRFMRFDGMSQTTVEMKCLGRHVASTILAPYCELIAQDTDQLDIYTWMRGLVEFPPSREGAKWYRSVFNRETFNRVLSGVCKSRGWEDPL